MAFENIDVGKLRSALNECKSSLNYSTSKSLAGSIANSSIWQSSAQGNLKNALSKLIDERYKELEDKIDSYLGVASLIEKYKDLEKKNNNLQSEIDNLYKNLYKKVERKFLGLIYYEDVLDVSVLDSINAKKDEIKENKIEMDKLNVQVSGSI